MKAMDFQDWTVITGDDVRRHVERDIFHTFHPNLYDAVLLVPKRADKPLSIKLNGSVHCYGCDEEYPFTSDILLFGSGGMTLDCPHCDARMEVCHWRIQELKGSLAVFAHRLDVANWITITPCNWSQENSLGEPSIKISEIGGSKSLP